jgi:hypothetical protein
MGDRAREPVKSPHNNGIETAAMGVGQEFIELWPPFFCA